MFVSSRKIEELEKRIIVLEVENEQIRDQLDKAKKYSPYCNPFDIFSMTQPRDSDPDDARDMGLG